MNTTFFLLLLVFGSLARAPSKECGRCLLTKFALAQFTARLFWRLGNQWRFAFNIFDAVTTHTVAGRYTRPIHTPHKALPLNTVRYIFPGGFAVAIPGPFNCPDSYERTVRRRYLRHHNGLRRPCWWWRRCSNSRRPACVRHQVERDTARSRLAPRGF